MSEAKESVTFLTEYYHPEGASTAQLMTELTTALTDGFDVSVVTGRPNYLEEDRRENVPSSEEYQGVTVERVRATRLDKDILPLRVINWITFSTLTFVRLLRGHRGDDAVLTLSNPPILPFVAMLFSRLTGTQYVYLVYDVYPDMAVQLGYLSESNLITRLWQAAMRAVFRDADRIVVLGESMRQHLENKMCDDSGFDPEKVVVIPNWEEEAFIRPREKSKNAFAREHDTVEKYTLVYSGNVGRFHEIRTAVDAIDRLEQRGRTDIQLLVIGEGPQKQSLVEDVERRDIDNVRFLPFQPLERLPETLTCGDASLVGIKEEMVGLCVSAKLYSSLAAGTPVLAVVGEGDEVARVVERHDCGAHVRPGDIEAAADVLCRWADNPDLDDRLGTNARACFEDRYTLQHSTDAYAALFDELLT